MMLKLSIAITVFSVMFVTRANSQINQPTSSDNILYSITSNGSNSVSSLSINFNRFLLKELNVDSANLYAKNFVIDFTYKIDSNCLITNVKVINKKYSRVNYDYLERFMLQKLRISTHIVNINGTRQNNCRALESFQTSSPSMIVIKLKSF